MTDWIDPEVKAYMGQIVRSLAMGVLWLVLNALFGLKLGFGIFKGHLSTGNIIYFIGLAASLFFLLWYLGRVWRKK